MIVEARGAGAPPKIVLSGPGRTIRTPDGPGALNTAQAMLAQDTSANTTYVALFSPPAGTWRVTGATSVRVADGLPPVRVPARVRRGVLTWSARGLVRGQRLQFVERARAGEANLLLTTRRARGRVKFTPDPALGTRRRIDAIVINAGTPRATETVARYRVAPPARPGRVRSIRLRSRTLTWRRDRSAVELHRRRHAGRRHHEHAHHAPAAAARARGRAPRGDRGPERGGAHRTRGYGSTSSPVWASNRMIAPAGQARAAARELIVRARPDAARRCRR